MAIDFLLFIAIKYISDLLLKASYNANEINILIVILTSSPRNELNVIILLYQVFRHSMLLLHEDSKMHFLLNFKEEKNFIKHHL